MSDVMPLFPWLRQWMNQQMAPPDAEVSLPRPLTILGDHLVQGPFRIYVGSQRFENLNKETKRVHFMSSTKVSASALDGGKCLASPPGKQPPVPMGWVAGRVSEPVWTLWTKEISLSLARNRTSTVQIVARRYTS